MALTKTIRPICRPSCTHTTMDLVHQIAVCDVCHQVASMGFLYECHQDRLQEFVVVQTSSDSTLSDDSSIGRMKALGFNDSIIKQASQGHYTDDQIKLLINQKTTVNKVIEDQTKISAPTIDENELEESLHPNITVRRKKLLISRKAEKVRPISGAFVRCTLRCCHTCRPYYRDRAFSSLNGIADDIDTALKQTLFEDLKVVDASIVRQLALRKPSEHILRLIGPLTSSQASSGSSLSMTSSYPSSAGADIMVMEESITRSTEGLHQQASSPGVSRSSNEQRTGENRTPLKRRISDGPDASEGLTFGYLLDRIRDIGRGASRKMLRRSLSNPGEPRNLPISTFEQRGTTQSLRTSYPLSHSLNREISSYSRNTDLTGPDPVIDDGPALSEIAVEEHVPDIITQV